MDKEKVTKPVMKVFFKRDFEPLRYKYKFTVSTSEEKVNKSKELDVLVLQTQFRDGFHWIDNVWILNEESEVVFMELMFGTKVEDKF